MTELHGKPLREFLAEEIGAEQLATALAGGEAIAGVETRIRRSDGAYVPIALSCGPVMGSDGRPGGAVAAFRDLSDAQQWRAHVLQTEKMASIGQLAAGVAHEINNPMGFIHANLFQMTEYVTDLRQIWSRAELLLNAVESGDAQAVQSAAAELSETAAKLDVGFLLQDLAKAIRESQEGSERIRHIVQDLRDFSHQDTGERVLADLNQCLDSTANIVWPMMKHVVVLSKHYGDLPAVPCYPMQLKQVFMNLLVNAYQAIEEELAARPKSGGMGTITLATAPHDGGVLVEITDTGTGIAPDHLDRIFDPFFTTKKVGAGTGLGLSTVVQHRAPARRHDASRERARARHDVPDPAAAPARGDRERARVIEGRATPCVLLVDDEPRILSALQRALRREGYELLSADRPADALRLVEERAVDCVVSDYKMPAHDRARAARAHRAAPPACRAPPDHGLAQRDRSRASSSGSACDAVLPKPWDDGELKRALRKAMGLAEPELE